MRLALGWRLGRVPGEEEAPTASKLILCRVRLLPAEHFLWGLEPSQAQLPVTPTPTPSESPSATCLRAPGDSTCWLAGGRSWEGVWAWAGLWKAHAWSPTCSACLFLSLT